MRSALIPAIIMTALTPPSLAHAAMNESWTLELDKVCDQARLQLPLPALDMSCDLDKTSGNPSKWFNPYETCELSFDMIGLPSIGDIAGGIAGQICEEVNEVKDKTIDDLIDEVNERIPDNVIDDIQWDKDINKEIGDRNNSDSDWRDGGNADPKNDDGMCYTQDMDGNAITVPCDITRDANDLNQCYFKTDSYSKPFDPVECSRYTIPYERCIVRWSENEYGESIPEIGNCDSGLRSQKAEACYIKTPSEFDIYNPDNIQYCRDRSEPIQQSDRLCSVNDGSTTSYVPCITIELPCYGHLDGVFQATSCRTLHNQFFNKTSDPFSNYEW